MRRGITGGKWFPFHLGHDLMITSALETMEHLVIVIANDSADKNSKVKSQMQQRYGGRFGAEIEYVCKVDTEVTELDEYGTAIDQDYLQRWADYFLGLDPHATHYVSSDVYGKAIAKLMGVEWFPVDPDRETVPISGTKIRSDLIKYWNYVVPEARYDWAFKVAILGPESTGKSTMVKTLGKQIPGSAIVPEYGRTLSEVKDNKLTLDDFFAIIKVQQAMIEQAAQLSPMVITDTEVLTTALFGSTYLTFHDNEILQISIMLDFLQQDIDYFVVLAPTVFWCDDGSRVMGDQEDRDTFFTKIREFLNQTKSEYMSVYQSDWYDRQEIAYSGIMLSDKARRIYD